MKLKVCVVTEYLIDNELCKMPNFEAISNETHNIFTPLPYVKCSDLDILTYTTVENNRAYLHINEKYIDQYYSIQDSIDCCFSYVRRNGTDRHPDVGISESSCKPFNKSVFLEENIAKVSCYLGADKIYENIHAVLTVPDAIEQKTKTLLTNAKNKPLSVLIIVIDSVARLNFERTMPSTRTYLMENNFIEFSRYNKIADNTFPNFNALLTGLNPRQSRIACKARTVGGMDQCPMIWYDYRDHGYATAYAEDWANIATFNYMKKGFERPPTDFYFKPYMEGAQSLLPKILDSMPYCSGPVTQGERILNVALDFAETFKNRPSFGIFWMNTFSHNYINTPSRMDWVLREFFRNLNTKGIFDDSMVVLLADHGMRFGPIRETVQGWYEERLPMNFARLPSWFEEKYPQKSRNFADNSRKLTSTYDMYMTLQDVLSMSVEEYAVKNSSACSTCSSLFSGGIREKRSCGQAGIPEEWCSCMGKFREDHPILTAQFIASAVKLVANSDSFNGLTVINKVLRSSITEHKRWIYLLLIVETTNSIKYQVLIKANKRTLQFVRIIQLIRLH
ncbi:unnamed protein product [Phyllotreta striolata]|uniref:Uncharacterized protein n=1 Tax=Phyllotreta striolata TaxID=444603 RepID=A0A9N9U1M6_PHYSR|nr:unnamed protein product [Phyllotreta striolata]